jgi:hypothetical protein
MRFLGFFDFAFQARTTCHVLLELCKYHGKYQTTSLKDDSFEAQIFRVAWRKDLGFGGSQVCSSVHLSSALIASHHYRAILYRHVRLLPMTQVSQNSLSHKEWM